VVPRARYCKQAWDFQPFRHQLARSVNHVAPVIRREAHLQATVGGAGGMFEGGLRVAKRIRTDDEILIGIERQTGPDQMVNLVMVQSEAVHDENGIVFGGV
jgi:hypothetical protein